MAGVAVGGYSYVPPADANYLTLNLDGHRGVYNSAWIGAMVAIAASLTLSLAGFYLVKETIKRDEETGVGQILAATPLGKPVYTVGKALSNFAVLAVMVGVLAIVAGVMQLIRGEESHINFWKLLAPFLFIGLPTMALVAALAVLFETISGLSKGFGNIVYFFLWVGVLISTMIMYTPAHGEGLTGVVLMHDPLGIIIPLLSVTTAAKAVFPA